MIIVLVAILGAIVGVMLGAWADTGLKAFRERELLREALALADTLYSHERDPKARLWLAIADMSVPDGVFSDRTEAERKDLIRAALQTQDLLDPVRERYRYLLHNFHIDASAPPLGGVGAKKASEN